MINNFKVGIDIGSTTIKVVVLDAEEKLVYKKYARHFSDIPTALVTNLTELRNVLVSLNGAAAETEDFKEDTLLTSAAAKIKNAINSAAATAASAAPVNAAKKIKNKITGAAATAGMQRQNRPGSTLPPPVH